MSPRLVLFDIDGTLIDTAGAGRRAMERAFHDVFRIDGIAAKSSDVPFAGWTDPTIFDAIAVAVDIEPEAYRQRRPELERVFLSALEHEMGRPDPRRRVLPGVLPLLDRLEGRPDVHLGLLTGNLEAGARIKLGAFGLNRYFPGGGFSSDHPDRREIARLAREKLCELTGLRFPPSDVVVVGDTQHDVDCARANGFRAVAVVSGWVSRRALEEARPDHLLDGLSDPARVLDALELR